MLPKIPITVIVTTLNEESVIARCLQSVCDFDEVLVVDSHSTDSTQRIAKENGAQVISFKWDKTYPKKRQWCLDTLPLKHNWVLFLDADEVVTPELSNEIRTLRLACAGYFIDGLYVIDGQILKRGFRNRKLCLINRHLMMFPVVDDLDIPGMGEMEGHYQPVLKAGKQSDGPVQKIGRLKAPIYHYAFENRQRWHKNHENYARWEAGMIAQNAFPQDPLKSRALLKKLMRNRRLKGYLLFFYHFILCGGFLEGRKNFNFSIEKLKYYLSENGIPSRPIDLKKNRIV